MKNDYRNTVYGVPQKNIIDEKKALEERIKREHPKVKIIYNQINKKDSEYNRAKKDFIWSEAYSPRFNVDDESITELFYRNEEYSIRIEQKYITDNIICSFYRKLKLDEEIRRLDFLLMNMYGFYNKYFDDKNIEKILKCIMFLQKKRNEL